MIVYEWSLEKAFIFLQKNNLNFHLINEDLNILKILQKSCSEHFSDFRSKKPAILSILDHFGQILTHFNQLTMLQKLSKCEVKAWLCWNLIILPTLRFCVKSHFGEFIRSKNVVFCNFRGAVLWILVNLELESCSDLLKIKIQNL